MSTIQSFTPDDITPFESIEDWNIHSEDYDLKATVREQIHILMPDKVETKQYGAGVQKAGWNGCLEAEEFGTIGFIKRNEDGSDGETV